MRRLAATADLLLKPLRVAVAASFNAEPLGNYLVVEGARRGLAIRPWFTPYNQFELQSIEADSVLFAERPDIVVLALRLEDLVPRLWHDFEALSAREREEAAAEACARVERMVDSVRQHSAASIAVFNFTGPARAWRSSGASPAPVVEFANRRLEEAAKGRAGVAVFDFARFVLESGLRGVFDARLEQVSRMPFGVAAQLGLAGRLARFLRALVTPPLKCLVLDLDNTLWGGVLGEAGPGGIALGNTYPGGAFVEFQRAVRALRQRGILLAIASKNNRTEVCEVFERHPDMVLRWDDFAAVQIDWGDKAASLRAIAGQLRIGTDALAFYDDNPLERAWVRSQLPEVTVIEVPEDPLGRVEALDACEGFDQVAVSEEDRRRAVLYEHDRQREEARAASTSLGEFLGELQIRASAGRVDAASLARVAQLIHKTNQFNLTARRYTVAELERQLEEGAIACWLRASDRFGDYGLVGAAFAVAEGTRAWRIDNFVMSCRILGRQVETALLAAVARQAAASGAERLIGEYVPTAKNTPARDFYASHGFRAEGDRWVWEFSGGTIELPAYLPLEWVPEGSR